MGGPKGVNVFADIPHIKLGASAEPAILDERMIPNDELELVGYVPVKLSVRQIPMLADPA